MLDGIGVENIHADLTAGVNASAAAPLAENKSIAFMGDTKGGSFDVEWERVAQILAQPNPSRKPSSDVVVPWVNGLDVTRRPRGMWIVDFGCDMEENEASRYEAAFGHVARHVRPERADNRREAYAARWWIHVEPRPALRELVSPLSRFVATPNVTKHRLTAWMSAPTLPDHQLIVFARSDDYFFGVLHSCVHEVWARRMGTQLREAESGFRYTPTTCFETFALPWAPGQEPGTGREKGTRHQALGARRGKETQEKALHDEIAAAAKELNELRENWLNPPEWIESVGRQVDNTFKRELDAVPQDARPLVRRSAIMAAATKDEKLKKRTLTSLYNERPEWLKNAHERLDRAVIAAYAAVDAAGAWDPEWAAVFREFGAGEIEFRKSKRPKVESQSELGAREAAEAADLASRQAALARRAPVVERVLANLLRLNGERA